MLAHAADGSLRDALSLLDQAIAYCGGSVEERPVAMMLGTIDRDHVEKLLRLLAAEDAVRNHRHHWPAGRAISGLFAVARRPREDVAENRRLPGCWQHRQRGRIQATRVAELAGLFSASDVQLFYQTALIGRSDLHLSPDPRSGAEMTLLRMLAFKPAAEGAATGGGTGNVPAKSASASRTQEPAAQKKRVAACGR